MKHSRIAFLLVAVLMSAAAMAQSVIFPQQQQAGVAVGSSSGGVYTLSNDLLEASFVQSGGHLLFGGCEAMGLLPGTELFTIRLGNGTEVAASQMTMSEVRLVDLTADEKAAKGSLRLPGKAIEANFSYGNLSLKWRAVLRDGSHYLRTEMSLSSSQNVAMNAIFPMIYKVDNAPGSKAPAVVGNTRGAVIASDRIFAGLETPMGINTTDGNMDTTPFAFQSWNGSKFTWIPGSETPQGILNLGFTADHITGAKGYLAIKEAGNHTIKFQYTSGSHRLDIAGVDALDPFTGEVLASDYHKGTTGGSSSNNTYTLNIPAKGYYLVRYFRDKTEEITGAITGGFNSNGTITWSGTVSAPEIVYDGDLDKNVIHDEESQTDGLIYPVLRVGGSRTDTWNTNSWTQVASADVPARIIEVGHSYPKVRKMEKTISFDRSNGTFNAQFMYASGTHGLTIGGVELIDADGNVAASDYHAGFSGTAKNNHNYSFVVPAAGNYKLRYYVALNADNSDNTSSGSINLSYKVVETLHLNAPTEIMIRGEWNRQTTLRTGKTWRVGAVVGLIAPNQARRSFLCYSERERAVPWRPFPLYNSWYELNIDRNNSATYANHFTEAQCLNVVQQWKKKLFDPHQTGIATFMWDDGWDEYGTWTFNKNFPNGFSKISDAATAMNSHIGAWLGPVGGYGQSGNYRRNYWNGKGGMQLSNDAYYNVFLTACTNMIRNYDFNYFKFDGISAQFSSVGPDAGATGQENAEAIIDIEQRIREEKPDIFFNTTVGTWASPFWFQYTDAVWRQENDHGTIGNQGNSREQWITYRDRLVYQNFVKNSPLCPINSMMTHGFMLSEYGGSVANMSRNYNDVLRELRCAFACGSGMVELYADYKLLNSINGGKLWADIAECIKWQQEQADVLPDVHWVGGNPWDGSNANVYGWAAWNGEKSTLALRNPATANKVFKTTLREALDIPEYVTGSITLKNAFSQGRINGLNVGEPIDIDAQLNLLVPGSSVFVYNGIDSSTSGIAVFSSEDSLKTDSDNRWYNLQGQPVGSAPTVPGVYIQNGRKLIVR